MRLNTLACLVLVASMCLAAPAAANDRPWSVSALAGLGRFSGRLHYPSDSLARASLFGARVGLGLSEAWILEAAGSFGSSHGLRPNGSDGASVKLLNLSASLIRQTSPSSKYGSVYVAAGGSYNRYRAASAGKVPLRFGTFDLAAGWRRALTPALSVRIEARGLLNLFVLSAGLTSSFGGKPRDTDDDGVPDSRDREPNTSKDAEVDAFGVAKDDDGDHVPNGIDRDNHTPHGALVDQWGQALDADHDGVYDGLDKCPETPVGATVDATGCPQDQDKDGVPDGLDKCPDTPVGATVDATGCAAVVGIVPPTASERTQEVIGTGKITSTLIHFDTGRSDLLPESNADLDAIGQALSQLGEIRIEVGGHCDIRGSDALNEKLSAERAKAVVDYLVLHFPTLTRDRLSSRGYGRSQPKAPNTTPEGMALNRRVEFKVLNPEVLKP